MITIIVHINLSMFVGFSACISKNFNNVCYFYAMSSFTMVWFILTFLWFQVLNRTIFTIFYNFNCHLQFEANYHLEYVRLLTSFLGWCDGCHRRLWMQVKLRKWNKRATLLCVCCRCSYWLFFLQQATLDCTLGGGDCSCRTAAI